MKKLPGIFVLIFPLALLLASSGFNQSVTVSGKLTNTGNSKYIYLYEFLGSDLIKSDSVEHKAGEFKFVYKNPLPRGFYKIGVSEEASLLLILSHESVKISADLNDLPGSAKIEGSRENQAYVEFKEFSENQNDNFEKINEEAQLVQQKYGQNTEAYNLHISNLQKKVDSLNTLRLNYYKQVQARYKGLFIEKFVKMFSTDSLTKETFFTTSDFSDTELARGDMLPSKISIYMQRYVPQNIESWKSESDKILKLARENNANKEVVYMTIIRNMANNDLNYARTVAANYLKDFPKSKFANNFWDALPKESPVIGEAAREIKLLNTEGKPVALSSLKGKVVLLDFWASWCGPCRTENPNVVRAYHKYKDKGFTVYSVSLDTDKERWLSAIEADGLAWENHVSDLKGWQSSAAREYGVKGIPSTFLLDQNGKVVAVNLRGESLHEMLEKLLLK